MQQEDMELKRRDFLKVLAGAALVPVAGWAWIRTRSQESWMEAQETARGAREGAQEAIEPLRKPKSEWRKLLNSREYDVLFEEDTERPFTSPLNDEKREGTFVCAACFLPLFTSETKFESGTGWPSFYAPIPGHMGTKKDFKIVFPRTEYHCIRCGGHQGHVFKDGPPPTGQRWCNNGVALDFVVAGDALPALRT